MADLRSVKICGIKDRTIADCAIKAGARYLGFVFFDKSPRAISHINAAQICAHIPAGVAKTALVVNATDAQLDDLLKQVPIDMLQLHGAETPRSHPRNKITLWPASDEGAGHR